MGEQYGSVSALALNHDCTRLLAGFAKGQICVFDLTSSKLLQTISDAHTPFTAVLHLKVYTDMVLFRLVIIVYRPTISTCIKYLKFIWILLSASTVDRFSWNGCHQWQWRFCLWAVHQEDHGAQLQWVSVHILRQSWGSVYHWAPVDVTVPRYTCVRTGHISDGYHFKGVIIFLCYRKMLELHTYDYDYCSNGKNDVNQYW